MKMKNAIVVVILSVMFLFSVASAIAQDPDENYIEEQGEIKDSLMNSDILLLMGEYKENKTPVIGILAAGAVVVAGGVFFVLKRRKKAA